MAKKTLGYVELEWTCPQCGTRNPGPQKTCASCGKPQPKKVAFHQAAEEKLVSDQDEIDRARSGPDVHCAFCGARNPATAQRCTQCGAALDAAAARESGRVLGSHRSGPAQPVKCPQCGALNEAGNQKCAQCNASLPRAEPAAPAPTKSAPRRAPRTKSKSKTKVGVAAIAAFGLVALGALAACVLIVLSLIPSKRLVGEVAAVSWTRTIEIEELRDVRHEAWRDRVPADARLGSCTQKHRRTQDSPAPNATEVCGTPYTVDTGTGYGEVVQDCEYRVYDEWCSYTVREWAKGDSATLTGSDFDPRWPDPRLRADQRERDRDEKYKVVFRTDGKDYTYTTSDLAQYQRCQIGTRWELQTNVLGGVKAIRPLE